MTQIRGTTPENYAAARAAGRKLLDAALQRNRALNIAATLAGSVVRLFRGAKGLTKPHHSNLKAKQRHNKDSAKADEPGRRGWPSSRSVGMVGKGGRRHG